MKGTIGSAEREVLVKLHENGGSWDPTQSPLWENRHWTDRLLASLAKKEMVTDHGDGSYTLNADGKKIAVQYARPVARNSRTARVVHSRGMTRHPHVLD
jgi:hypothetical protein